MINRFSNLSIRFKLLLSYLLLTAIPLIIFLFVNIFVTARESERQTLYSVDQTFHQTISYIEYKMTIIRNSLNFLSLDDTLYEILSRDKAKYSNNIGLWAIDSQKISSLFHMTTSQFYDIKNPLRMHLYMKQGLASVYENDDYIRLDQTENTKWSEAFNNSHEMVVWLSGKYFNADDSNDIIALRRITTRSTYSENIGILRADISEDTFTSLLDQARFTSSTTTIIIDDTQSIICVSHNNQYKLDDLKIILSNLPKNDLDQVNWMKVKFKSRKLLIAKQSITKSNWYLLLITPYTEILGFNQKTRRELILIFVIVALFTFPFSFYISSSITKRIKCLINKIKHVENGEFETISEINIHDEIGELINTYNFMVIKIQSLLIEEYCLGKEVKSLELKALQAQINPHFLYNTLDLINWFSIKAQIPEITQIIQALSQFYKLSLSKGEDFIPISAEIDHIRAYITIQNMRFNNSIQLITDISPKLSEYLIPKLIL